MIEDERARKIALNRPKGYSACMSAIGTLGFLKVATRDMRSRSSSVRKHGIVFLPP